MRWLRLAYVLVAATGAAWLVAALELARLLPR